MLSNKSSRRRFQILSDKVSDEQKDNLSELKETIAASVDNPPTQETIQATITEIKDEIKEIVSDGIITDEEKQQIATGIQERINSLGVTESEAQEIISAVKEVIAESPLPQLLETYQGSTENPLLLNLGGDNIRRFQVLSNKVSDEQKDNLSELKETIAASVDNPPTLEKETIQATINEIKDIVSDGIITDEEKQQIATGIQERINSLGVTESEAQEIISAVKEVIAESPLHQLFETYQGSTENPLLLNLGGDNIRRFQVLSNKVSDEQKDNLSELKETIAGSVDNPPTLEKETIKATINEIKEIASDGIITDEEKQQIATGIQERITSLGVTESEAQEIISAVKEVIAESPLPQLFETYQGTPKKDFLLGFRDNILVGSSGDGQEEEDILMEGLGQKQFIFNTNFDNDGLFRNDGIRFSDVPFVRNLNIADGAVQINGSADDYTLGNLGEISDSLQGKFANLVGSEINYIEPGLPLV